MLLPCSNLLQSNHDIYRYSNLKSNYIKSSISTSIELTTTNQNHLLVLFYFLFYFFVLFFGFCCLLFFVNGLLYINWNFWDCLTRVCLFLFLGTVWVCLWLWLCLPVDETFNWFYLIDSFQSQSNTKNKNDLSRRNTNKKKQMYECPHCVSF